MLAKNNRGTTVDPGAEAIITSWVSDGYSYLTGFMGTGTFSAEFRLYVGVDKDPWFVYSTSPGNRTAYVADRSQRLPAGTEVKLCVIHEDQANQIFKGTILGGA